MEQVNHSSALEKALRKRLSVRTRTSSYGAISAAAEFPSVEKRRCKLGLLYADVMGRTQLSYGGQKEKTDYGFNFLCLLVEN